MCFVQIIFESLQHIQGLYSLKSSKSIHNFNKKVLSFSSLLIIHNILSLVSCISQLTLYFGRITSQNSLKPVYLLKRAQICSRVHGLSTFRFESGFLSCPPCFPYWNPFCLHQHVRLMGCPPIGQWVVHLSCLRLAQSRCHEHIGGQPMNLTLCVHVHKMHLQWIMTQKSEGPKGGRRKGGRGCKLSHFSFCCAFCCCVVYSPCFPVWGEEKVMTIYDAGPLANRPPMRTLEKATETVVLGTPWNSSTTWYPQCWRLGLSSSHLENNVWPCGC